MSNTGLVATIGYYETKGGGIFILMAFNYLVYLVAQRRIFGKIISPENLKSSPIDIAKTFCKQNERL